MKAPARLRAHLRSAQTHVRMRFWLLSDSSDGKQHEPLCTAHRKRLWAPYNLEFQKMTTLKATHPSPDKPTRLLTPSEAASFLSISNRTLTRLIAAGDIGCVRIGGQRRFELVALLSYVARQRDGG
jgi:excisionase family DNA binding protein